MKKNPNKYLENSNIVNEEIVEGGEGKSDSRPNQSVQDEREDNFTDTEGFDVQVKMEPQEEGVLKCNIEVNNSKANSRRQNSNSSSVVPEKSEKMNTQSFKFNQQEVKMDENSSGEESDHSLKSQKSAKSAMSEMSRSLEDSMQSLKKGPGMDQSLEEVLEYYEYLRSRHSQTDSQWEDPDFPNNVNYLGANGQVPERFKDSPIEFSRVDEVEDDAQFFFADKTGNIQFFFNIKRSHQIKDLFFLGAVLMLFRKKEEFMKNLVIDYKNVEDNIKAGFCGFTFFINGEWKHVTVDTFIPCHQPDETILTNTTSGKNSVWLCLLQKAYAKIHRTYEVLNDVSVKNTLVDLTGGISKKILIKPQSDDSEKKALFDEIRRCITQKYLIGSMKFDSSDEDVKYLSF